jgi:hypothetical protein
MAGPGSGSAAFYAIMARLEKLSAQKAVLLGEQSAVSGEMHRLLTIKGEDATDGLGDGALENSKKATKNLTAAIVQSKQPGYFEYHHRSRRVKDMEKRQELKKLTARIARIGDQLAAVTAELDAAEHERQQLSRSMSVVEATPVSGLKEWFGRYGEPSKEMRGRKDLASTLVPNTKVYGGTSHHRAFRSVAVTLKRGTLVR